MPQSKSPASRAARRIVRQYLRYAMVATSQDKNDIETCDNAALKCKALEPKLEKALKVIAA